MAAPGPSGTDVLLERGSEIRVIADAVARTVQCDGRVLVIEGPAGIGKSSLLQSAGEAAEGVGMQVLTGCGDALEREFGFGLVRQLLRARPTDAMEVRHGTCLRDRAG